MRLLLACVIVLLAPAASLVVTERYVAALEGDFWKDSYSQVTRLNRVSELYPPNVKRMKNAGAILQLKQMTSGQQVAASVCATPDSPYFRLFERLTARCADWALYRRARWLAFLAALVAGTTVAMVLMARIAVQRAAAREEWPGAWTHWFLVRGIPLFLLVQVALSLAPYSVLLSSLTGRLLYANAILLLPFAILFWLERRFVLAFVEPRVLTAFRPKRASRGRRSRRPNDSPEPRL
jgi:hypothetical protein